MYQRSIYELIRQTSTNLPADIVEALIQAKNREAKNSRGKLSLEAILKNIELAQKQTVPICQDTGWPTFFVIAPYSFSRPKLRDEITAAVRQATRDGLLRPNAVDSITGEISKDNLGEYCPTIYFERSEEKNLKLSLLLKGGGSENVSEQVMLPCETRFGYAERGLEGVKKAVLEIVAKAQGRACPPGVIAVAVGGDRARGWLLAKRDLLRPLNEENPDPRLRKLEAEILEEANQLAIGPLGLGGKTTLLSCRISVAHRLPACYFVTVAYACWANRRGTIVLNSKGKILQSDFNQGVLRSKLNLAGLKRITFPASEAEIRKLRAGDLVLVSGRIFTARDRIHTTLTKNLKLFPVGLLKQLKDSAIYHCGPVALKKDQQWTIMSAGPTTSARLEKTEANFIEKTGVRAVIGKGGMGPITLAALKKHGAVYLHAIGGAAAFYGERIKQVNGVHFLKEFGIPEAMWDLSVEDFLAVVSMDSRGRTLHN